MKKLIIAVYMILALSLFVGVGSAAQLSETLTVTANVPGICSLATSPVNFGLYSGSDTTANGAVHVTCNTGISYTIALAAGSSGSYSPRQMLGPFISDFIHATLNYNLYADAAHTSIWGDGSGVTVVASDIGNNSAQSHTVYGLIPAGQNAQGNGGYGDSITVTVTY